MAAAVARALIQVVAAQLCRLPARRREPRRLTDFDERHVGLEEPEISDAVHEEADDELRDWN